ncbi:poly polymerase 3-like protein [Zopfochytrium polystomum]|nr:poly polymerase 3-like protein [Zopfochytrium polystomum]
MPPKRSTRTTAPAATSADADNNTEVLDALKDHLRRRNLDATGSKDELILRLLHSLDDGDAPAPAASASKPAADTADPAPADGAGNEDAGEGDGDGDGALTADDVAAMTVAELKEELEKRGLSAKGRKQELADRLTEALKAGGGGAPPDGEAPAAAKPDAEEEEEAAAPKKKASGKRKAAEEIKSPVAKKAKIKVDECFTHNGTAEVYEDYGVMLNQTNISANNNKFYVLQLVKNGGSYTVYTRWGRVGERGMDGYQTSTNVADAIKNFKKKFKDKTSNDWESRDSFVPKTGKYTLIEMDHSDEPEEEPEEKKPAAKPATLPDSECTLPKSVQYLIQLIFNPDMFVSAMRDMEIDVNKMPLGKLSKNQIKSGFTVLEELQAELDKTKPASSTLERLTSKFYTLIPHSFGRRVPPVISDVATLQKKIDLLNTLGDIEIAQSLQDKVTNMIPKDKITSDYESLKNNITPVDPSSDEFKWISQYTAASHTYGKPPKVKHAFRIDRQGEKQRADAYKHLGNRKLLWHGTGVAVVAAILSTGLRIMPHSGGRVGRGIYFASENNKSYGYTGFTSYTSGSVGCMFLNEVILGKEYTITRDDSSLRKAPAGFDSVVARGSQEPDSAADITIDGEYGPIVVPVGVPKPTEHKGSSFNQSEYLVYDEAQVRMKYVVVIERP